MSTIRGDFMTLYSNRLRCTGSTHQAYIQTYIDFLYEDLYVLTDLFIDDINSPYITRNSGPEYSLLSMADRKQTYSG